MTSQAYQIPYVTLIFDKCPHSLAAVTPVKYEREIQEVPRALMAEKRRKWPNRRIWFGKPNPGFIAFLISFSFLSLSFGWWIITLTNRDVHIYIFSIGHDDVIKWKHFPRYWPFVRGIHRFTVNSPQRPVTRSFDVFFDLRLNKRLSKQSWGWWFETPSRSLWRHCNVMHHPCVLSTLYAVDVILLGLYCNMVWHTYISLSAP